MDYTFGIGNGMTVLVEHFWKEVPNLEDMGPGGDPGQQPPEDPDAPVPVGLPDQDLSLTAAQFSPRKSVGLAIETQVFAGG